MSSESLTALSSPRNDRGQKENHAQTTVLKTTEPPRPDDGTGVYKYTLRGFTGSGFAAACLVVSCDGYVGDIEYICTQEVPLGYLCD